MAASQRSASHPARWAVRSRIAARVSGRSGTADGGEADVGGELGPVEALWPTARGRPPWAAGWDGRRRRRGGRRGRARNRSGTRTSTADPRQGTGE